MVLDGPAGLMPAAEIQRGVSESPAQRSAIRQTDEANGFESVT